MARVYSALLASWVNVNGSQELGGPAPGNTWVVRAAFATFGSYLAYVQCGFSVGPGNPVLWLCTSGSSFSAGVHASTFTWEGRLVVPDGYSLYAHTSSGDTCDVLVSGYNLVGP